MAAKSKDTAAGEFVQQSIRFAPAQLMWLSKESERLGASFNALVRQLVDDSRTFFGLPPTMVRSLEEERRALGLDFRQYVQELLTRRYRDLLKQEFESGTKSKRSDGAKE